MPRETAALNTTSLASTLSQNKKLEASKFLIEEKGGKAPGTSSRFTRRKIDTESHSTVFDKKNELLTLPDFCQQILVEGYVQSYIDFYYLTHRCDPAEVNGATQIKTSLEDMVFIRDNLLQAELARRQGETSGVYSAYGNLAELFVKKKDWKTCFFFHEKSLEVAQLTSDIRAEMAANHSLGTIYQLMLDFDGARSFHERHEQIAESMDVFEEVAKANVELYKVYLFIAERFDDQQSSDEALLMYKKCLEASKKCWDRTAEGEANGRIGNLLLSRGETDESLPYLKQQSIITSDLGNAEGRCRACSSLAYAYDSLGLADKALSELSLVNSISKQAGDTLLQAQACKALGTLYSKVGKMDEAVDILQKHFNLVKTIIFRTQDPNEKSHRLTPKDLDIARVYIGISKGNQLMGSYVAALHNDLSYMLDWKLQRADNMTAGSG